MEYLANEKAHELSLHPAPHQHNIIKHPSEKIYRPAQIRATTPQKEEPDDETKKMDAIKMREERLKKN